MNKEEEHIWQILTYDRYYIPVLHSWYEDKQVAETRLQKLKELFPDKEYWIEEGKDYIYNTCRNCGSVHATERYDHYGITTGYWCDDCYEHYYPYRKDAYFDPSYAGERLEEDY